jgi:hypothetical protein
VATTLSSRLAEPDLEDLFKETKLPVTMPRPDELDYARMGESHEASFSTSSKTYASLTTINAKAKKTINFNYISASRKPKRLNLKYKYLMNNNNLPNIHELSVLESASTSNRPIGSRLQIAGSQQTIRYSLELYFSPHFFFLFNSLFCCFD